MRPNGCAEIDSLYFSYPYFDAPTKRDNLTNAVSVAIIGGGPVGMTAALSLAKHGVRSVLLEAKSTFNDGSRAICVARQSYRILDKIGAVEPFLKKSLPWTTGRSFYRGRQVLEFQMPDSAQEKFRPMYNIQQQYIEQYLWDAISRQPLIDMRWQSQLTGVADDEGQVILTVKDPYEEYTLRSDWVLAADGARSAVRSMRDLRLKGENHEGNYVIADIKMEHDYPTIRRALFDPDCRRGSTVLVHKQPDNIWRIDYQLKETEDQSAAIKEDTVRASVAAVLQDIDHTGDWELEWWSTYSANTLALDDYRDGKIFFIGDSAHIVPIFGVRGLNNGFADAYDIGWKLGCVLQGEADIKLLNSYSHERRGATLDVFRNASKSAQFITPPGPGWRLMRNAALNLALSHPFAGELANPRQMTPYTYAESTTVSPDDNYFTKGPVPGAVMPDAVLGNNHLFDRLGTGFSLISFNDALVETTAELGLNHIILPLGTQAAIQLSAGPHTAYLVRPDTHIAARWVNATSEGVHQAMLRATSREIK